MPKQSPNLSTVNSILTQESGQIPMNHKKCEKVREIDEIGGVQPDLARRVATFLSQGFLFRSRITGLDSLAAFPQRAATEYPARLSAGATWKHRPAEEPIGNRLQGNTEPCRTRPEPPQKIPARTTDQKKRD